LNTREQLFGLLDDMELVVKIFGIEFFEIYFLGGAACILGGYTDRATRDFDFIDLEYKATLGRAFNILRDYDMLEYSSTILAPDFKSRAMKLGKYKEFNAYVLAPEDIVVSKIIRLEQKDLQDIGELIVLCDKKLINKIISDVLGRDDLFESKKQGFMQNLQLFREQFDV